MKIPLVWIVGSLLLAGCRSAAPSDRQEIPASVMKHIYEKIQTPYKYGVVIPQPDKGKMVDSPTIFRKNGRWYMTYIIFDGRGYETWLAESGDLLEWKTLGKTMSFSEGTWDSNQKAGYVGLVDYKWGGLLPSPKI